MVLLSDAQIFGEDFSSFDKSRLTEVTAQLCSSQTWKCFSIVRCQLHVFIHIYTTCIVAFTHLHWQNYIIIIGYLFLKLYSEEENPQNHTREREPKLVCAPRVWAITASSSFQLSPPPHHKTPPLLLPSEDNVNIRASRCWSYLLSSLRTIRWRSYLHVKHLSSGGSDGNPGGCVEGRKRRRRRKGRIRRKKEEEEIPSSSCLQVVWA